MKIVLLIFFLTPIQAYEAFEANEVKDFITRYINALQSDSEDAADFLSEDFKLTGCDEETKLSREQVLNGPVFEKFGILNEVDWSITEVWGKGTWEIKLDGFIYIEYFIKTIDSKMVIVLERQFNFYESYIGFHIASKLFEKYKDAIFSKDRKMILEIVASNFSFNRPCRNLESIDISDFVSLLENLSTETVPLYEANVLSGNIENDMMEIQVLSKPAVLINYLLKWSEEKKTFIFMEESSNICRYYNDYISPLIDEKRLAKILGE